MSHNRYAGVTAERRRAVEIPALHNFKCDRCGKFKRQEHFSNKQINEVKTKVAGGMLLDTAARIGKLVCRPCKGDQVQELQCEGPCGLWKALDAFSKAQRTRGNGWCQECVLWKESDEPGVPTAVAPGTSNLDGMEHFAVDEDDGTSTANGASSIAVPYTALATLSITNINSSKPNFLPPPHLRDLPPPAEGTDRKIENAPNETQSQSSASNPYENTPSEDMVSTSAWSVGVDVRRRAPLAQISHHIYDPSGKKQTVIKVPTVTTASSVNPLSPRSVPSTPQNVSMNSRNIRTSAIRNASPGSVQTASGNSSPNTNATANSITNSATPTKVVTPRNFGTRANNSGWAKPAGKKELAKTPTTQVQAPPLRTRNRAPVYDSESDDEP